MKGADYVINNKKSGHDGKYIHNTLKGYSCMSGDCVEFSYCRHFCHNSEHFWLFLF